MSVFSLLSFIFLRSYISMMLLVCIRSPAYSQELDSGEVMYKVRSSSVDFSKVNVSEEMREMMANEMEQVKNTLAKIEYSLRFNGNESVFQALPSMEIDNESDFQNALLMSNSDGIFYSSDVKSMRQLEAYGEIFLITKEDAFEWKLSSETKMIDTYLCYKATKDEYLVNSKGQFKKSISAWYCPDIPMSTGPVGYAGLPGLILELKRENYTFYATSLDLNPSEEIRIDVPDKGVKISKSEFEQLGKKMMNNTRGLKND